MSKGQASLNLTLTGKKGDKLEVCFPDPVLPSLFVQISCAPVYFYVCVGVGEDASVWVCEHKAN